MSCCTRRFKAAATAGAVRKSMSATHMGSTSGSVSISHLIAFVPRRGTISSKSYFMRNCICLFINTSEPPRKFHSRFRFCTAGRLPADPHVPAAYPYARRCTLICFSFPHPYRHAMRGNEKRGSRKLPRFLFFISKDFLSGLLAVRRGLEPLTPCVTGTYSNQLN